MTAERPQTWIFCMLGPPGSGKGTQCNLLSQSLGWNHLSLRDVLRAELHKEGSEYAEIVGENMQAGRVGLKEITIKLLKRAMHDLTSSSSDPKASIFLIDGKRACGSLM